MKQEISNVINFNGKQINMFSDDRADYVSLTDIVNAYNKNSKSVHAWLKTNATLAFLDVWEKKHNPNYSPTQLRRAYEIGRQRNGLSVQAWNELTGAIGIFAKSGYMTGTFAHKDIAIRFAAWMDPEIELFLVEEIQRLKDLERQKNSFELLNQDQILALIRLKEVFKFVAHQEMVEEAHKDLFAARSGSKNPFAEFNKWRNEILGISKDKIDERIKEYCVQNNIALTTKLLSRTKRDKILLLDSYEAVKIAVWDFLMIEGNLNAFNLATLVEKIIRIEKGDVLRKNETELFHQKQSFGEFEEFEEILDSMPKIKTAREVLEYRKQLENKRKPKPISEPSFDQQLKGLLSVPPPKKDK